jgi:hypothetical protein
VSRLGPAGNEPVLPGAAGRVHVRRNAGPHALRRLETYLKRCARGPFMFARWGDWIVVDLAYEEDVLAVRRRFPNLLDGWRAFP